METARAARSEFRKKEYKFRSLAFSPDGQRLAAEAEDGPILLLDATTMREAAAAEAPRPLRTYDLAFTPDGKELLAIDGMREVRAWDAATGKYLCSCLPPADRIPAAAFSPDRKLVAFIDRRDPTDQHTLRLLDLATGKDRNRFAGHESAVNSVSFSPDGKMLASTGTDGVTFLWELPEGREVWRIVPKDNDIGASAFSPSGLLAAPGQSGRLELFDLDRRKSQAVFGDENTEYCRNLAFSSDGKTLAFAGAGHSLWFWDVDSPNRGRLHKGLGRYQVALDREGRYAAAADGGAWLGQLPGSGDPRWLTIGKGSSRTSVALASDGATLAVGSWGEGSVVFFNAVTSNKQRQLQHADEPLRSVALSSSGRILATGGAKGSVRLFDTTTGAELLRLTGHEGPVSALAFSADGSRLASAGSDTTVLVWDLARALRDARRSAHLDATQVASLWDDLASPDNTFALWVAGVLNSDPARAMALFKDRLKPVTSDYEERLRRAITDLQDEDFKVRERALDELRRIGSEAIPPLRELQRTATDPRLQARLRAFLTIAELDGVTPSLPDVARQMRAVAVLETIGTPEAREVLEELAKGAPSARLTETAQAGAGTMAAADSSFRETMNQRLRLNEGFSAPRSRGRHSYRSIHHRTRWARCAGRACPLPPSSRRTASR